MNTITKIFLIILFTITLKADTFENAVNFYLEQKYYKAFKIFDTLANQGNADAQYNLGMLYYTGKGIAQNKVLAFIWFDTASNAGHRLAQNKLGYMYEKGEVVGTQDQVKAFKEFLKSAVQNYDLAQLNLGMKYNNNIKEESLKRALFWYQKAADNGNTAAMNNLANMYYAGQTIPKDHEKAYNLYFKAAKRGDAVAQFNISMMYYNGEYVKQSDKETLSWLTLAAKAGLAIAQVRLGTFYREGYSLVNQNYKKALYWYYEAAKQKSAEGEFYVGFSYFYGFGVKADTKKATYWIHKAKLNGYSHANTFMKRNNLNY